MPPKAQIGPAMPDTQDGSVNNPVSADVRSGEITAETRNAPDIGEKGEYRPATYTVPGGITRTDC